MIHTALQFDINLDKLDLHSRSELYEKARCSAQASRLLSQSASWMMMCTHVLSQLQQTLPSLRQNNTWLLCFSSLPWSMAVPGKHCCYYGQCISDLRYQDIHSDVFFSISKTLWQLKVCKKWTKACYWLHRQLSHDSSITMVVRASCYLALISMIMEPLSCPMNSICLWSISTNTDLCMQLCR